ncbi:MAG: hypothetical protein JO108_00175 [Acidobacteriaceae bacterium]|nr:hypothetical protein [Acidobacteriaceae bacterium]
MIRTFAAIAFAAACALAAINQETPVANGPFEVTSLLGRKLYALPDDDGSIRAAQRTLQADPKNPDLALKLSKAQAAKRQYREAVTTCTAALAQNPANAALYLERGHRELGLRDFKTADSDLQRAIELDPKQLDSYYHFGLANYFLGDFNRAVESFAHALDLAQNSDSVIDCSNWLYVSRRRAGQKDQAAKVLDSITPDLKNNEPHLFFYLQLLRFYKGALPQDAILPPVPEGPDDIEGELSFDTINYGIGNWHLYNDSDRAKANQFFSRVVKGYAWNAWGFIGSEIELAKRK